MTPFTNYPVICISLSRIVLAFGTDNSDVLFDNCSVQYIPAFENQITNPNSDLKSFANRLEDIVNYEWELRFNKKLSRFLKKASLKYPHVDLDETLYDSTEAIRGGYYK